MKSGFLDRDADLDSPLHRLDPRVKIVLFFGAILTVASEPPSVVAPFPYYFALIAALAFASRVPARRLLRRAAAAAPFLLAAAALPYVSLLLGESTDSRAAGLFALSVILRGAASVLLLVLLVSTSAFHRLLWALRRLRAPEILGLIATLMYRYLFILMDEWRRATQARECRSAGRLRLPRAPVYGKQLGVILMRSWDRADRVHAAMTVRGFDGRLPVREPGSLAPAQLLAAAAVLATFVGVRALA